MSAVTVKAYLYSSWNQDPVEIRRFTVEQEVATSYDYLVGKVRAAFPALKETLFDVYWEDEEHDRVSISTDEELLLAISGLQSTVFKLYLKKSEKKAEQQQQQQQSARHYGVVCDGCQQGIVGVRYKCLSCPDYDLCSRCESQGVHTSHDMAAIEQPQQQRPRPCHPCGPPHFAGFNPWAGFYQPRGGCCRRQCPRTTQPTKTTADDGSPFVLSTDERECVQNIGGAVSSFLKPYGINVDVNVANLPNEDKPAAADGTPQQDQPWLPVVEQLKGMGFDDDGGWLTELVKAKGNDIHKVLDALNHGR